MSRARPMLHARNAAPSANSSGVAARLDELRGMRDGWMEGKGVAPTEVGLDWLTGAFATYFPHALQVPRLYPTPEGGVQAEWRFGPYDASLNVDLSTKLAYWHVLNLVSNVDEDDHVDLSGVDGWSRIARHLMALGGAEA